MKLAVKISSLILSFLCLFLIFQFRTIPSGKLWNEYYVLYVPSEVSDSAVYSVLRKKNIPDSAVVSLSVQYLPVTFSENSPEISVYRANYKNSENSYENRRNLYFFDSSNNYRLYYISHDYKSQIDSAVTALNAQKIKAGTDKNTAYPWILPVLVLFFSAFLAFYSKNKKIFICGAIVPFCFVLNNPFFPSAFSVLLLELSLFFLANVWKRPGAFKFVFTRPFVILTNIIAVFCAFSASLKTGFFYMICLAGTAGFIFLYYFVQQYFVAKLSFKPLYIKSAAKKSLFNGKNKLISLFASVLAVVTFGIFFLTSSDSFKSRESAIKLPGELKERELQSSEKLPGLEDYTRWVWNIQTGPYKSLNSNNDSENEVVFPQYVKNVNGILERQNKRFVYDKAFCSKVTANIDKLNFNSIEKVLKSQNPDFKGSYQVVSALSISRSGIIAMTAAVFLLIFLLISTMMGKGAIK